MTLIRMSGEALWTGADFERLLTRWTKHLRSGHFMRVCCEGRVLWINPRQISYMNHEP